MEKYRAWHIDRKQYYSVKGLIFNFQGELTSLALFTDHIPTFHCFLCEVILEPYIKLNDKNGKEIYEGDILRTKNAVTIVGEPSWFNNCFGYDFEIAGGKNFIDKCRVVGNVHEDKVLL